MESSRFYKWYVNAVIFAGALVILYCVWTLPIARLDKSFVILAVITIILSSNMTVQIPKINGHISVSDTLIFLTLLLYGGQAAILVAATEGLTTSLLLLPKFVKISIRTIAFNAMMLACSTLTTVVVTLYLFGSIIELPRSESTATYISALFVIGLMQYASNSSMAAIYTALKLRDAFWRIWIKHYLWASITYLAGISAAGIIAKVIGATGFFSIAIIAPIIAIIFLTYRMYMQNVEAAAVSAKAEQAQHHIEELNHYIAEQERLRGQVSHLEKMSALGELASGVAHDFNNTLAGILGRAQLLLRTDDVNEIKKGLELIVKTTEDGAKTVKRIQDFARQRRDQQDFLPIMIDQLLLDVSELTRPRWKDKAEAANIHINLELQIRSQAFIMGDASELREVLVNIIINAVDAMPKGGTLTLSVGEVNEFVQICVKDTGVGMPPEVYTRIFDPFFTTKGKGGMGLGLAVSYGIIRRHGGFIEVSSAVEKGTTFRINLPIAKDVVLPVEDKAVSSEARPVMAKAKSHAKILVLDDEEHIRTLLNDILETENCEVAQVECGQDALELLEKEKFDAIFTDVGMPGMSGWELVEIVRKKDIKIPIVLITGWGEIVGPDEQKEKGVDWVVAKPFNVSRIIEVTNEIKKRREGSIKLVA